MNMSINYEFFLKVIFSDLSKVKGQHFQSRPIETRFFAFDSLSKMNMRLNVEFFSQGHNFPVIHGQSSTLRSIFKLGVISNACQVKFAKYQVSSDTPVAYFLNSGQGQGHVT